MWTSSLPAEPASHRASALHSNSPILEKTETYSQDARPSRQGNKTRNAASPRGPAPAHNLARSDCCSGRSVPPEDQSARHRDNRDLYVPATYAAKAHSNDTSDPAHPPAVYENPAY